MIDTTRLSELVGEALERTAFFFAEPSSHEAHRDVLHRYAVIRYEGEESGEVHLAASDAFLLELASSLLGEDASSLDASREGAEALAELANIIGGSIVVELGGERRRIALGLPEISLACPFPGESITCTLNSEGEPLCVTWIPRSVAA